MRVAGEEASKAGVFFGLTALKSQPVVVLNGEAAWRADPAPVMSRELTSVRGLTSSTPHLCTDLTNVRFGLAPASPVDSRTFLIQPSARLAFSLWEKLWGLFAQIPPDIPFFSHKTESKEGK